jgi:hydroxymethylglutaryl-CoA lyase
MMEEMGIETGINLDRLIACASYAGEIIQKGLPGHLIHAGRVHWEGI